MNRPLKFASVLFGSLCVVSVAAAANPQLRADAGAVDQACASEAATAHCSGEQVGQGMLKCIANYRKTTPDFRLSAGCAAAVKQLRADRQQAKAAAMPAQ